MRQKNLFFVFKGNNPDVVKLSLLKRGNWAETDEDEAYVKGSFIWKPVHLNDQVRFINLSFIEKSNKETETYKNH